GQYQTREQFIADINLMRDNCITFNGRNSEYTKRANEVHEYVVSRAKKLACYISEASISPLSRTSRDLQALRLVVLIPQDATHVALKAPLFAVTNAVRDNSRFLLFGMGGGRGGAPVGTTGPLTGDCRLLGDPNSIGSE
ncbi:Histone acetyltransferase kat2b, partial [Perkinsus olseni]